MIFLYKRKDNIVQLTAEPRQVGEDDELVDTELLLTLDWDFYESKQFLEMSLRPWKDLNTEGMFYKYCDELLNWFMEYKNKSLPTYVPQLKYVFSKDIDSTLFEFYKVKEELEELNLIEELPQKNDRKLRASIVFDCDIWNYLTELYSVEYVNRIQAYMKFNPNKRRFIRELYAIKSKDSVLSYIRDNKLNIDIESIVDFLPNWCIINLILSEPDIREFNETSSLEPEFKSSRKIDNKDFLRKNKDFWIRLAVYDAFKINDVWKGADIKKKLEEIYTRYESDTRPTINSILEYFEISKTRLGYKIGFRKNNYVL